MAKTATRISTTGYFVTRSTPKTVKVVWRLRGTDALEVTFATIRGRHRTEAAKALIRTVDEALLLTFGGGR